MNQTAKETSAGAQDSSEKEPTELVLGLWDVRYQVKDVGRSVNLGAGDYCKTGI
jgi:hypothetical protein